MPAACLPACGGRGCVGVRALAAGHERGVCGGGARRHDPGATCGVPRVIVHSWQVVHWRRSRRRAHPRRPPARRLRPLPAPGAANGVLARRRAALGGRCARARARGHVAAQAKEAKQSGVAVGETIPGCGHGRGWGASHRSHGTTERALLHFAGRRSRPHWGWSTPCRARRRRRPLTPP